MSENYIVINGKKLELTEKQLKALGIKTRNNPFERVAEEEYYYINTVGGIASYKDMGDSLDNEIYSEANYFNDETFANQVALHQLLYRKLLKFAYDNGIEDTAEWDGFHQHWIIAHHEVHHELVPNCQSVHKTQAVHFSSADGARSAIKEVIEPFMKEHPEFVW